VPMDIVKHLSVRSIEAFRSLSTLWRRFLGFEENKNVQEDAWIGSMDPSRTKKRQERSGNEEDKEEDGGSY
jgi:hypothetical protein